VKLERNVFGMLDRSARAPYGGDPAFGFEGQTRTFCEMRDRALRVAYGLTGQGVRPGDRVAVMMGNRLEWPEVFFGLAAMGAICVPINVLLTAPEIAHVCDDSGSTVLVMDEIAMQAAGGLSRSFNLVVTVGDAVAVAADTVIEYETMLAGASGTVLDGPALDDTFILYYSSGTTGLPKAAEHTHDGVLWNAAGQITGLGLTRDVRYAVIPSFSWAAGLHNLVMALVWIGGYSEIRRTGGATAEQITSLIVDDQITHVMLVPSILRSFVARPDLLEVLDGSTLEWIVTGSEPVPRSVIERCVSAMPDVAVCQGYGLSEFPSIATVLTADEVVEHEGSAGRPLPFTDVCVRDADGVIQSSGRGELLIRSLSSMRGYYQRPDQTKEAFRDGWMHTGDLVDLDEGGYVTVVGRTKDLIISGGLNVYPKEIEDVLHRLPGVQEVAVVGVPHETFGETAVAVIVTTDPDFDPESVAEACREQLASYKRPRSFLVRTEPLPRSANAKLLKREIRPWAMAELGITEDV
jgi:fatty-acyl-CoA synthase